MLFHCTVQYVDSLRFQFCLGALGFLAALMVSVVYLLFYLSVPAPVDWLVQAHEDVRSKEGAMCHDTQGSWQMTMWIARSLASAFLGGDCAFIFESSLFRFLNHTSSYFRIRVFVSE